MLKNETAFDLHIGDSAGQNPWVQSIWMFAADLFAAFVPVLPESVPVGVAAPQDAPIVSGGRAIGVGRGGRVVGCADPVVRRPSDGGGAALLR